MEKGIWGILREHRATDCDDLTQQSERSIAKRIWGNAGAEHLGHQARAQPLNRARPPSKSPAFESVENIMLSDPFPGIFHWEEPCMDQCQCRGKL